MPITTTPSERIGLCTRMRRFLVRFIRPESFVHTRSSAGFTITTSEFKFSVHTGSDCAVPELTQNTAIQLNRRVSLRPLIDALPSRCRAELAENCPPSPHRSEFKLLDGGRRPPMTGGLTFLVGLGNDEARTRFQFCLHGRPGCRGSGLALVSRCLCQLDLQTLMDRLTGDLISRFR